MPLTSFNPTEEDWKIINAFKPPEVYLGCPVSMYREGDTTGSPKWGFITKIEHKTVVIRQLDGDVWLFPTESLRHINDPELRFKPNLKQKGTWDLHPTEVARRARLQSLEDRIRALEGGTVAPQETNGHCEPEPEKPTHWGKLTPGIAHDMLAWSEEGKKPTEIAEILGAGWNKQKVGIALKKLKSEKAEAMTA